MVDLMLCIKNSFAIELVFILLILMSFYYYGKAYIFHVSPGIASRTHLIDKFPLNQVVGVVELTIVSICHAIFCIGLLCMFHISIGSIFKNTSFLDCMYGVLIGIGSIGLSILLCSVGMKVMEKFAKNKSPHTLKGWMTVANAGWIRHHKHTIQILPIYLALAIITIQIGSEEIIFRPVLFHALMPYGLKTAFFASTILFIFMQTLHMPSIASAMFPVIGATVMGITHGLLYLYKPSVAPLIISHLTFFIFTVL